MKLSVKLSDKSWGLWFLSATITLALSLLVVTTYKGFDIVDIVVILAIAFVNFLASVIVGIHKQETFN